MVKTAETYVITPVLFKLEESGVNFSGGEIQKLDIARAIYKDAPIVILDEPTAARFWTLSSAILCTGKILQALMFFSFALKKRNGEHPDCSVI